MSRLNLIAFRIPFLTFLVSLLFIAGVGYIGIGKLNDTYRYAERDGCRFAGRNLAAFLTEEVRKGDCEGIRKHLETVVQTTPVSGVAVNISGLHMQCQHHVGPPVTEASTAETFSLHDASGLKIGEMTVAFSLDRFAQAERAQFVKFFAVSAFVYLLLLWLIFRSLTRSLKPLQVISREMKQFNPLQPSETVFETSGSDEVSLVVRAAGKMFDTLVAYGKRLNASDNDTTDSESHLKEAQRMANIGSWEYHLDTDSFSMSTEMYRILALNTKNDKLSWEQFLAFVTGEDKSFVRQVIDDAIAKGSKFHMGYRIKRVNGDLIEVHTYGKVRKKADGKARVTGVTHDVTEQNRTQRMIEDLAYFDALTGLPNRVLLRDRLQKAIEMAKRSHGKVGVLFLDLDHFKLINDTMGHHIGDKLLRYMADVLKRQLRASDTISRIGGDEFVVILPEIKEVRDAELVADKLIEALVGQHVVERHTLFVSTSIGVALYPDHAEEVSELVKCADTAMYEAKQKGRQNWKLYSSEMGGQRYGQLILETELYEAVKGKNAFALYYQPIVDPNSGELVAVEALLRWHHKDEMIEPELFIPLLESSGLIVEVGFWVIENVAMQIARWQRSGKPVRPVMVNLSAHQLHDAKLPEKIEALIEAHSIDSKYLGFEVSEAVMRSNVEAYTSVLQRLKKLGVALGVDRYGRGLSSIEMLARFPVDMIKIDHAFIREIAEEAEEAKKVEAIVSMARVFGLKTVIVGIEEAEQYELIRKIPFDYVQGYLYGRPLSVEALERQLEKSGIGNREFRRA
jgi:diguanylate cyclase (GGDEF)-like protein